MEIVEVVGQQYSQIDVIWKQKKPLAQNPSRFFGVDPGLAPEVVGNGDTSENVDVPKFRVQLRNDLSIISDVAVLMPAGGPTSRFGGEHPVIVGKHVPLRVAQHPEQLRPRPPRRFVPALGTRRWSRERGN